jgi:hypothetical protein
VVSPLGEGEGFDPDPPLRFDAVDCLTFVEEVMALSLSSKLEDVRQSLDQIRYADQMSYSGRNHLMEAEWLPNNVKKGFLSDVTSLYGGEQTVPVTKKLTKTTWGSRSASALALPKPRQVEGSFSWKMVPLAFVLGKARQVPSGTVLVVVREERPLLVTRISHLGFVVHKKNRVYLRHASRSFGYVVDEDLETFLSRNGKYTKWPVVGASFYEATMPATKPVPLSGPVQR